MSKTPRADEARELDNGESCYALDLSEQLETELYDMRTIFVSYILSEEAWRESKKDPIPMLIEANFMKEKAKEALGL